MSTTATFRWKRRHEGGVEPEGIVNPVVDMRRHRHEPQHGHPKPRSRLRQAILEGLVDLVVGAQQKLPLRAAPRDEQGLPGKDLTGNHGEGSHPPCRGHRGAHCALSRAPSRSSSRRQGAIGTRRTSARKSSPTGSGTPPHGTTHRLALMRGEGAGRELLPEATHVENPWTAYGGVTSPRLERSDSRGV